jgi:hypothetical protein
VTNWWEHLFSGKSDDEAGVIEEEHGMKLARAAAQTTTLEHYIWSTTPSAKRVFNGEHLTPHVSVFKALFAKNPLEFAFFSKKKGRGGG